MLPIARCLPVAFMLLLLALGGCRQRPPVTVQLENVGTEALDSVWLFATGDSVFLGSLAPGEIRWMEVGPRGESHLELSHLAGAADRLVIETYFEPGYRGPIRVRVRPDSAWTLADARPDGYGVSSSSAMRDARLRHTGQASAASLHTPQPSGSASSPAVPKHALRGGSV